MTKLNELLCTKIYKVEPINYYNAKESFICENMDVIVYPSETKQISMGDLDCYIDLGFGEEAHIFSEQTLSEGVLDFFILKLKLKPSNIGVLSFNNMYWYTMFRLFKQ
jgi:hypothetical protein